MTARDFPSSAVLAVCFASACLPGCGKTVNKAPVANNVAPVQAEGRASLDEQSSLKPGETSAEGNQKRVKTKDSDVPAIDDLLRPAENQLPRLIAAVAPSNSKDLRLAAINAIAQKGRQATLATDAIIKALEDPDLSIRVAAASTLPLITEESSLAITALTRAMVRSTEPEYTRSLANALSAFGDEASGASPSVLRLSSTHEALRDDLSVAFTLLNAHDTSPEATQAYLRALRTPTSVRVRYRAVNALSQSGRDLSIVLPALLDALDDSDPDTSYVARAGILRRGSAAAPLLLTFIEEPNNSGELRDKALELLAAFDDLPQDTAARVMPFLEKRRFDPGAAVLRATRENAIGDVVHRLAAMDDLSLLAVHAADLGTAASVTVPELLLWLESDDPRFVSASCNALAAMHEKAKDALPRLNRLLNDSQSDSPSQIQVAECILAVDPSSKAAVDCIRRLLNGPESDQHFINLLYATYSPDPFAKDLFDAHFNALHERWTFDITKEVFSKRPSEEIVRLLIRELESADEHRAARAASLLGAMGPNAKSAENDLIRHLAEPRHYMRFMAAAALVRIGGDITSALPILESRVREVELTPNVVSSAADAGTYDVRSLEVDESIEPLGPHAVPLLARLLKDSSENVRAHAKRILGNLPALSKVQKASIVAGIGDRDLRSIAYEYLSEYDDVEDMLKSRSGNGSVNRPFIRLHKQTATGLDQRSSFHVAMLLSEKFKHDLFGYKREFELAETAIQIRIHDPNVAGALISLSNWNEVKPMRLGQNNRTSNYGSGATVWARAFVSLADTGEYAGDPYVLVSPEHGGGDWWVQPMMYFDGSVTDKLTSSDKAMSEHSQARRRGSVLDRIALVQDGASKERSQRRIGLWDCYFGDRYQLRNERFCVVGIKTKQRLVEGMRLSSFPSDCVFTEPVCVQRSIFDTNYGAYPPRH